MAELSCLFHDQHIYALHKPEGVPFHNTAEDHDVPSGAYQEGMVALSKRLLNDENIFPVHRLDKMTSGLMIFARHAEANRELSAALVEKRMEKYYLGVSLPKPKKKQGAVIGDMLKSRLGSYKLARTQENPAITRFFARPVCLHDKTPAWLFALKPETGKTHQLRVAMKSLGSPILGDLRYSGDPASRGYLHAYRMKFDLFGRRYSLCAPDFNGNEFSVSSYVSEIAVDSDIRDYLAPDILPWGQAAFKLPSSDNLEI